MGQYLRKISSFLLMIMGLGLVAWLAVAGVGPEPQASRAYVGHETDADMKGFIRQYPGAARWSIQGDTTQGVIIVTYANGQSKRFTYRVVSKDEGTISFDGVTFAYAGAPKCR